MAYRTTFHDNRTTIARITNPELCDWQLDHCGISGSKLWNVAKYYTTEYRNEHGSPPDNLESHLKSELKDHPKYRELHSQSSQRTLEEFVEAFTSYRAKQRNGDHRANPPGYRKHYHSEKEDEHPRSTITWKANGFKHDAKHDRFRLSKGREMKDRDDHPNFIHVEYETRNDVELGRVQQVRAVYHADTGWQLHIVHKVEKEMPDPPGDKTAGIDLGICVFAAVLIEDHRSVLYPGGQLKQAEYYFLKEIAKCDNSGSRKADRLHRTRSRRRTHFLHAWAKDTAGTLVENDVGTVYIGKPEGIRTDDETGEARNWGPHGNLDLHSWPFARAINILEYKLKERGIELEKVDERDTSKTCSLCGEKAKSHRIERGLYRCDTYDVAFHSDGNGGENIRIKGETGALPDSVTSSQTAVESTSESVDPAGEAPRKQGDTSVPAGEDRSTGRLARPRVRLFDMTSGFQTRCNRQSGLET